VQHAHKPLLVQEKAAVQHTQQPMLAQDTSAHLHQLM
jgi:hypothetical protein